MEKYGFVYIWRDCKHNRYYIGSHWGTETDGYVCSSRWMKKTYKRRPQDFKRKILVKIYSTKKQLLEQEYKWLSLISDEELGKKYYNFNKHKNGHWTAEDYEKDITPPTYEEIAEMRENIVWRFGFVLNNMAEKTKQFWQNPGHRESVGKKISQSLIGRPSPVKNTFWWNNGLKNTRKAECPGPEWVKGKI